MTEQIVPPVPHAENHGNAGETGEVVETVGIEPTQGSRRESGLVERRYHCRACRRKWPTFGGKYPDLRCPYCHSPHIKGTTA